MANFFNLEIERLTQELESCNKQRSELLISIEKEDKIKNRQQKEKSEDLMDYRHYEKAASRHFKTCEYLLSKIREESTQDKQLIIWNLYYLSGYIIECSFKYVWLSSIYKQNYEFNLAENSLYKSHNIIEIGNNILKPSTLKRSEIPWFNEKHELREKWTVNNRYIHPSLTSGMASDKYIIDYYDRLVKATYLHLIKERKIKHR